MKRYCLLVELFVRDEAPRIASAKLVGKSSPEWSWYASARSMSMWSWTSFFFMLSFSIFFVRCMGTRQCMFRFYCEPELQFISSLRVNDGLCDCCDGSDEWKGVTIPHDVVLDGKFTLTSEPQLELAFFLPISKSKNP